MRTDIPQPVRLADYRPSDYLIDRVELDIKLHATATRVQSKLSLRPNPKGVPGAPLILDGDDLKAKYVLLNGAQIDSSGLFLTPDQLRLETPPQEPFHLEIETEIDPTANTRLMGLYRSGTAYCTQCEAEGFRRITYFLDRPDVLSVYTTRIEADFREAQVLLGNGNRIESGTIEGTGRHFAIWHDPFPKPCYLFALVGGILGSIHDRFVTRSGRDVALGIYVEPGKETSATYAMDALKRSMAWDEEVFGREYDLDVFNIVAVSDFNMGAMENKGLNVFNDKYVLASPATATDTDYAQIEAVIAHEYFHNWTGNRITCRDWFQLCLKEGLTVYRDHEFSADMRSRAVRRIADVRTLRSQQFPEDAGPLAHNVRPDTYLEINNFYTATVYEKGAELIRMLKVLIGDEAFHKGMDLYFARHDGTAATIEEFIACFAEAAKRDLTQFSLWYHQSGTPHVEVESAYDKQAQTLTLDFTQSCKPTPGQDTKQPFLIPIAFGLIASDGAPIALQAGGSDQASEDELARGVIELATTRRRVVFQSVPTRPVPSLLRGFSAPVRLGNSSSEADLLTLVAHDTDSFNRWQAAQTYATRQLLHAVEVVRSGRKPIYDEAFIDALLRVLEQSSDPAFIAQVITLPGEADLAREIGENVDPDAIHGARKALRQAIGEGLKPNLLQTYQALTSKDPYSPDATAAGRRALRNAALDLFCAGNPEEGLPLALQQFESATTMTDKIAALSILTAHAGPEREKALEAFYATHASEALVIDKWFILQATIPEPETLARVKSLMQHAAFSLHNPNRTRSLIGAFATGNQTQFNAADGSGYDFLAGIVLELDSINPQVAARLLAAFRSWRSLETKRQGLAEAALRRVASVSGLSPDVKDIAERSLG
ncbi:aminopeptidase N [Beijerinckia indica]|uniref:Aminopeptidase N n=1 Tax=Beijerinckia indica subsp. indica (strain ATCC 9039 / DSM 1715 / NCIMB 8712) TaxID=395963 RepID=B2IHH9_BEII9|nr:aminopeptidase N [Beijerinckia indica]ACB94500.1 aminopeptidase N [Beijerinckia indica subsp. indica ATCC 9039]